MKAVTAVIVDFDELARRPDAEIIERFIYYSRSSRKRLVPSSVAAIANTVRRQPELLSIDLFNARQQQVAVFSFAPVRFH